MSRTSYFDFTPLARRIALALPAYMASVLVVGLAIAVVYSTDKHLGSALATGWSWVSVIFPLLGLVLAIDLWRGLRTHSITTTQVVGHRAAAVCTLGGALLGLSWNHHWAIAGVTAALTLAVLVTPRKRAAPSTWQPGASRTVSQSAAEERSR